MIKYTVKFTKERPIAVARVGAVLLPSVLLAIFYSRDAHSAEAPQLPASVVKALAAQLRRSWIHCRSPGHVLAPRPYPPASCSPR